MDRTIHKQPTNGKRTGEGNLQLNFERYKNGFTSYLWCNSARFLARRSGWVRAGFIEGQRVVPLIHYPFQYCMYFLWLTQFWRLDVYPKNAPNMDTYCFPTFANDFFCKPPTWSGFSGVRNCYFYTWLLQILLNLMGIFLIDFLAHYLTITAERFKLHFGQHSNRREKCY